MELTTFLAVWGSLLGTASLIWNVWTWWRNNPRIAAVVEYVDFPGDSIRLELRNRGTRPSTIEQILLVKYQSGWLGFFRFWECIENLGAKHKREIKLPALLSPGEVWKGFVPIGTVDETSFALGNMNKVALIETGKLFYKIRVSQ